MKKKTQKIIICISLVIMLFVSFGNVFGATNPEYTPSINVSENALDTKIQDSVLLDTLANMINAVASLAEYLIGAVFKALTGDNIFPWADRIIFNGIAFLDINFLNPDPSSLFGSSSSPSILGEVVQQVYSTIFSLAVLFLGVAVGVMAIRLAISSIAAEKAKYKQAIVNWVTCIVMLFLMHYILAFVFWINEQLVRVASGILIQTIDERGLNTVDFQEALDAVVKPEERVALFCQTAVDVPSNAIEGFTYFWQLDQIESKRDELLQNKAIANTFLTNDNYVSDRLVYVTDNTIDNFWGTRANDAGGVNVMVSQIGLPRLLYDTKDAAKIETTLFGGNNSDKNSKDAAKKIKQVKEGDGYFDGANGGKIFLTKEAYVGSNDYKKDLAAYIYCQANSSPTAIYSFYAQHPEIKIITGDNPNLWLSSITAGWQFYRDDVENILGLGELNNYDNIVNSSISELEESLDPNVIKRIVETRLKIDGYIVDAATGKAKGDTTDIIANLGSFFKQSAYVYTSKTTTTDDGGEEEVITGWRASKLSVTGALLYAIFIFQSCMYFIMYVKRLFYVIMLSMFGPIVVIYDFFIKSAS